MCFFIERKNNMKKFKTFLLISSIMVSLTNCNNKQYTTFKEYTEIVKNASETERNIFIFTATNCAHCQKIIPYIDKYIKNNDDENLNIYKLNVDYWVLPNDQYKFKDETMGYLSGNSENDCIKQLDNRIAKYVSRLGIIPSDEGEIAISSSQKYTYTVTPLILFYEGNIEVKIVNNVSKNLQTDEDGKIVYDSLVELLSFPEEKSVWNREFDLTPYVYEIKTTPEK